MAWLDAEIAPVSEAGRYEVSGRFLGRCALLMRVRVECYAGRKAYERPLRFWFDDHLRVVEEVLESWYGPSDAFFKVRADDGIVYILRHDTSVADGKWSLVLFDNSKLS